MMWTLAFTLSLMCLGYTNAFLFSSVDWSGLKGGCGEDLYTQNWSQNQLDDWSFSSKQVKQGFLWTRNLVTWNQFDCSIPGASGEVTSRTRVTWDANPFNSQDGFASLPRTINAANRSRFTTNANGCDEASGKTFLGRRYLKDNDTAVMLLFDNHGYIAGIQVGIPKNLRNNYPSRAIRPPWIDEGQQWILTVYFVDPSIICHGRSQDDFATQGTGTNLYIQMGRDPIRDSVLQPKLEANLVSTPWVRHRCFRTMGVHCWYNTTVDMDCDYFFPVFLMYNSGKLNAFGWAMGADLPSIRYEQPSRGVLSMIFDPVPRCLMTDSVKSTLHIYLDCTPLLNFC